MTLDVFYIVHSVMKIENQKDVFFMDFGTNARQFKEIRGEQKQLETVN